MGRLPLGRGGLVGLLLLGVGALLVVLLLEGREPAPRGAGEGEAAGAGEGTGPDADAGRLAGRPPREAGDAAEIDRWLVLIETALDEDDGEADLARAEAALRRRAGGDASFARRLARRLPPPHPPGGGLSLEAILHALRALGEEGVAATGEVLAAWPDDEAGIDFVWPYVVSWLVDLGAEAAPALEGVLAALEAEQRDPTAASALLEVLAAMGDAGRPALPRILIFVDDRQAEGGVRRMATWTMVAVAGEDASVRGRALGILDDASSDLRPTVLLAWAAHGPVPAEVRTRAAGLLGDEDPAVRVAAGTLLEASPAQGEEREEVVARLRERLLVETYARGLPLARALAAQGRPGRAALEDVIRHHDRPQARLVAWQGTAAGDATPAERLDLLLVLLEDDDLGTDWMIRALGMLAWTGESVPAASVMDVLERRFAHGNARLREGVLRMLPRVAGGEERVVAMLVAGLADEEERVVRVAARQAHHHPEHAGRLVPGILAAIHVQPDVRQPLYEALVHLGRARPDVAMPLLEEAAAARDEVTQTWIVPALDLLESEQGAPSADKMADSAADGR